MPTICTVIVTIIFLVWERVVPGRELPNSKGWYFRVLQEGIVESNVTLRLMDRPFPEWTVATANRIMHHERGNPKAAEQLHRCPLLSASWQRTLRERCQNQNQPDPQPRQFGDTHS